VEIGQRSEAAHDVPAPVVESIAPSDHGGTMTENDLLTPSEVADMFRVNPKTVTRWARAGKISTVRTLGGHRRFHASEIRRFLEEVEDLAV
jgi:excisionase family DNA binding protein